MNKTTRTVALIVAICIALAVYFVLLGQRGIQLIQDGGGAAIGLGIGVLIPAVPGGCGSSSPRSVPASRTSASRSRFTTRASLSTRLRFRNCLRAGSSERLPTSCSPQIKVDWEADPDNWKQNFRLARAYDYAGDRSRARETMRRAVELERRSRGK